MEVEILKKENQFKKLMKLANNHRSSLNLSVLLASLGVIFGILPFISGGKIAEGLISNDTDKNYYILWCLTGLLGYALKTLLYACSLSISHKATFSILADIRIKMIEKLPKLSLGTISETPSGAFKQKIVDQVESMESPLAHMFPEMTANLLGPVFVFLYLLFVDWRMGLLSLVSFPIGMFFMASVFKSYGDNFAGAMKIGGEMNSSLVEYVNGLEVIRSYNQTDKTYKKITDKVYANAKYYYDWMTKTQFGMSMSKAITPTTLLAILPLGYIFYKNGSLSLTGYLLSIILSFSLQGLLNTMMRFTTIGAQVGTLVENVESVLNATEQIHSEEKIVIKNHDIELNNVSFEYEDGQEILSDISLQIKEGTKNAFVGLSGGGKSTIAKLIAGFWDVKKGVIKMGDIPYENIPLEELYDQVSFVSQDNFLFDDTIRENIRMGDPKASDKEVEEISKKAGCHEFISHLENAYETRVGKQGESLSGGERQRIVIARAMLKNAPIVIFDEATAYMDPENEYLIQNSLNELIKNKTVIVIAHRLYTIKDSDKIFVVNNGKIEDSGKHEDLLNSSETYKKLWKTSIGKED